MVLTLVSVGAEATGCTKHQSGLSLSQRDSRERISRAS